MPNKYGWFMTTKDVITLQNYIEMSQGRTGSHSVNEKLVTNKDWILDYKINREQHYVEVTQWNGCEEKIYFQSGEEKEMQEKLDQIQKEQFDKMVEAIDKCVSKSMSDDLNILFLGLAAFLTPASLGLGLFFFGSSFLSLPFKHLKLERNLKLVGWIIDNKKDADSVIHRDVDSKRKTDLSKLTPYIDYSVYPDDAPYSEEMYNNGINLNNIPELSTKQLQKLKKKTISFQERKNNCGEE